MTYNPYEGYEPEVLAATDEADLYLGSWGRLVTKDKVGGYGSVGVLPELTGKPWNNAALNLVMGLQPSSIRVSTGMVTCDCSMQRVTVLLEEDERTIRGISQEVNVGTLGCRFSHDIHTFPSWAGPVGHPRERHHQRVQPQGVGQAGRAQGKR